jgi:hypothetical protein
VETWSFLAASVLLQLTPFCVSILPQKLVHLTMCFPFRQVTVKAGGPLTIACRTGQLSPAGLSCKVDLVRPNLL